MKSVPLISLFIFVLNFPLTSFAGPLEEAEKAVRGKYAFYGHDGDETTDTDLRRELNTVRENYARAQAEQAAKAIREESNNAEMIKNHALQTALYLEQLRYYQLQQAAALEQKYNAYALTAPSNNAPYEINYENVGYQILAGVVLKSLLNGVVNLMNEYAEAKEWRVMEAQRQTEEELERVHRQAIQQQKKQILTIMLTAEHLLCYLKHRADKVTEKNDKDHGFFLKIIGKQEQTSNHSPMTKGYRELIEKLRGLLGDVKFPDLESDSFEDRILGWSSFLKAYNRKADHYNEMYPDLVITIDPQEFFSDHELGTLAFLTATDLSKLTNAQLASAFPRDQQSQISELTLKLARDECRRRRIVCGDTASNLRQVMILAGEASFVGSMSQITNGLPIKINKTGVPRDNLRKVNQRRSIEDWAESERKKIEQKRRQLQANLEGSVRISKTDIQQYEKRLRTLDAKEQQIQKRLQNPQESYWTEWASMELESIDEARDGVYKLTVDTSIYDKLQYLAAEEIKVYEAYKEKTGKDF